MANQQLRDALPEVGGIRMIQVPYDTSGDTYYPEPTPPVPAPCWVVVVNGGEVSHSFLYLEIDGQVQPYGIYLSLGGS